MDTQIQTLSSTFFGEAASDMSTSQAKIEQTFNNQFLALIHIENELKELSDRLVKESNR
jgi:uncharacterized protein YukE